MQPIHNEYKSGSALRRPGDRAGANLSAFAWTELHAAPDQENDRHNHCCYEKFRRGRNNSAIFQTGHDRDPQGPVPRSYAGQTGVQGVQQQVRTRRSAPPYRVGQCGGRSYRIPRQVHIPTHLAAGSGREVHVRLAGTSQQTQIHLRNC